MQMIFKLRKNATIASDRSEFTQSEIYGGLGLNKRMSIFEMFPEEFISRNSLCSYKELFTRDNSLGGI